MPSQHKHADHEDAPTKTPYRKHYCACQLLSGGVSRKYVHFFQSAAANSCPSCDAYGKTIVAVVDGCLPEAFRGPRDEAERTKILHDLVVQEVIFGYGICYSSIELTMNIMDQRVKIIIFRDEDEQSEFKVRGKKICYPMKSLLGPTTASDQGFKRARRWLRQCLENHDCGTEARGSDADRRPKRLLDLRGKRIRLVETDKSESRFDAPYVCLSHRWGDAQHRRLTSTVNTIQQHLQGILWDDLPRTFQDAVTICRRMSVEYLWIDSLCILQGFNGMTHDEARQTEADFAQENSMMATIYRNSYFTISADMSTSMDSGIFCARSCEGHGIQVIDDSGNVAQFRIRESISHSMTSDLETRGWTFQEYMLPARVLGFGSFDISWRCQDQHTCECQGTDEVDHWRCKLGRSTRPHRLEGVTTWWQWMISFYSSRKLTNEKDKLPALSGMAQICNERINDTYLAGLWQISLHRGLCWYHLKDRDSYYASTVVHYPVKLGVGRRSRGFRAPSWSWASLDACDDAFCCPWWPGDMINPGDPSFHPRKACTIYDAVCKPKTKDAFGEVEPGAFINLGTKLISATIAAAPDPDAKSGLAMSGQRSVRGIVPWTLSLVKDDREVIICIPDCRLEDDGLELGDSVYCAPVLEDLGPCESQLGCLVLRVLEGQQYRRVGFCVLGKKSSMFPHYTRQELDDFNLTLREYEGGPEDLSELEKEGKIIDHALQFSQEAEVRITIL